MSQVAQQFVVYPQASINPHQNVQAIALFLPDGSVHSVPKRAAAQTDVPAMTSTAAITGGEPPTEAEFNQLRADVVAMRTVVNSMLAKFRTAGTIAP